LELKRFYLRLLLIILFLPGISYGQDAFDFYVSNTGKDTYPGNVKALPKQTIAAAAPLLVNWFKTKGSVKLGLKSGDTFNENLITSYPVQVGTYTDDLFRQNDLAILNGSKEFDSGWVKYSNSLYTYTRDIPYTGFTGYGINGIGSYSYIYVTEIDKDLEKTAPFTARKLLTFVTSPGEVDHIPGSFYSPVNTNENPKHIFIHTSNGNAPGANSKYRYEVTVRDFAINSTYQANNVFENLWVRGFGAGIGMLPGGDNSYYNKIIFGPGAGIHHLVVRSGIINHSLFLPGAKNTSDFAVVFYDVEGLGRHCTIKNSMFLNIPSPVYAHTSLGTNYGAVEISNVVAFADTTDANAFMFTSDNDTVLLNNVYSDGYKAGYNYGTAKYVAITNSYFKDVTFGIGYSASNPVTASVDNTFIKTKGTSYTAGIYMQPNTSLSLNNSIIHVINNYRSYWANAGTFVYQTGVAGSRISASGNIFICDIAPVATLIAANTNAVNGISNDSWNNNVYILLKGNKIQWTTSNPSANGGSYIIQNFGEWKRQSGQDKNSLFFDLRNDPRGLKAIFVDPDNGNYDLANTPEGYQIAALHAGMTAPLNCFLQKPVYEEAADLVRNNKVLSVNGCRNPCQQNSIRVNNTFEVFPTNDRQVKLTWSIAEQQNIIRYELQKATGNSVFKKLSIEAVTPADSVYRYTDEVQPGIPYLYRLMITDHAGGRCYTAAHSIKTNDNKLFTIYPNPSTGNILVLMNGYIGNAGFTVLNSNGQIILKKQVFSLYNPLKFDLTIQPKGIYFLKVETTKGIAVQKFSIQ
jgi:hypothetical protein